MSRPKLKYKPVNAYVPIQIGNIEELVKGTDFEPDRIRAIYHQFYLKRLSDSTNNKIVKSDKFKNGWVSIHSNLLKKVATNNYKKYIDFLEKRGLLILRKDEKTGGKKYGKNMISQQYKIPEHLLRNPDGIRHFRKERINDYCTLKSINKIKESFRKSIKTVELNPTHIQLKEMLKQVRFDIKRAEIFLKKVETGEIIVDDNPEEDRVRNHKEILLLMDAINEGNYIRCKVDLFGERLHTPITNLWKDLRQFIYFENEPNGELTSFDFSNSQPYFSSIAINTVLIEKVLPEYLGIIDGLKQFVDTVDFKKYSELCANGMIYNFWREIRGIEDTEEGRFKAKGEIFLIMFSKKTKILNYKKGKSKDFHVMLRLFNTTFPSVYACFNQIKSINEEKLPFIKEVFVNGYGLFEGAKSYHKALACMMQRMESRIMLGRIVPKLVEEKLTPFLTVHDSIIIPKQFAKRAEEIINNEFKILGVNPPYLKP